MGGEANSDGCRGRRVFRGRPEGDIVTLPVQHAREAGRGAHVADEAEVDDGDLIIWTSAECGGLP